MQYRRDVLVYFERLINESMYLSLDVEGIAYVPKISLRLELHNPKFWNIICKQVQNILRADKYPNQQCDSISSILVDYAIVHPFMDARFYHALEKHLTDKAQFLSASAISNAFYGLSKMRKAENTTLAALEKHFCDRYRDVNTKDLTLIAYSMGRLPGFGGSKSFQNAYNEVILHNLNDLNNLELSIIIMGLGTKELYLPCVDIIHKKVLKELDSLNYFQLKELAKGFGEFNRGLESGFVVEIDNMEEGQVEKSHRVLKSYIKERLNIYN
jgi:hypothetical protein